MSNTDPLARSNGSMQNLPPRPIDASTKPGHKDPLRRVPKPKTLSRTAILFL